MDHGCDTGSQPCNGCRQRDIIIAERDLTINNLLAQIDRMERGIDAAVQERCDRIVAVRNYMITRLQHALHIMQRDFQPHPSNLVVQAPSPPASHPSSTASGNSSASVSPPQDPAAHPDIPPELLQGYQNWIDEHAAHPYIPEDHPAQPVPQDRRIANLRPGSVETETSSAPDSGPGTGSSKGTPAGSPRPPPPPPTDSPSGSPPHRRRRLEDRDS